jgi:hypothetical protein
MRPGKCTNALLPSLVAVFLLASGTTTASAAAPCTAAYSGDTIVEPGAPTRLAAHVDGGPLAGVLRPVTFTLSDAFGTVLRYQTRTGLFGNASLTATVPEGVYGVTATVPPNILQPGCSTPAEPDDTLLAVPSMGAFTAGAGTVPVGTTGSVRFALAIRLLTSTTAGGQFQARIIPGDPVIPGDPLRVMSFRASSVAIPSDPIIPDPFRAQITGSGTLDGQPGYRYALTAIDGGPTGPDAFALQITNIDHTVIFSSGRATLASGNIEGLHQDPTAPPAP